jgi:hypothetical protein
MAHDSVTAAIGRSSCPAWAKTGKRENRDSYTEDKSCLAKLVHWGLLVDQGLARNCGWASTKNASLLPKK